MFEYLVVILVSACAGMLWGAKHPERPVSEFFETVSKACEDAWARLRGKKKPAKDENSAA